MRNYWTTPESELVIRLYPEHGKDWDGWAGLLPGRTPAAISHQAGKLGVQKERYYSQHKWTRDEDDALLDCVAEGMTTLQIFESGRLPGRTFSAIAMRRQRAGELTAGGGWTRGQRARVRKSMDAMAARCGHTVEECIREYLKDEGRMRGRL